MRQFSLKDLIYLSIISFFAICAILQHYQITQSVSFDNTKVHGIDVLMRMIDPNTGILSIGPQGQVDVFFITYSEVNAAIDSSINIAESLSLKGGNHPCCFRINDNVGGIEVALGFETRIVHSEARWNGINRRIGGTIEPGKGRVFLSSLSDAGPSHFWCVLVSRSPGSSFDSSMEIAVGLCERDLR